ncbi:Ku protein, partial [Streptomyces sp. NPDC023998]|uniref:non-homologous end joining protein Ku n=1 Tax=Streptomyces sp. NPDC023998 TaxID=3154597 RepID=UPI0033F3CEC3
PREPWCHPQRGTAGPRHATESEPPENGGRIRNRKVCETCGKTLDLSQIGRGYETADGSLIEITDADLDALPLESVRAIEVQGFNPYERVDLLRVGKAYYLAPNGDIAAKPYALIVQALQRTSKVAIAKFALRDRERLGLLRVKAGVLVLHQLLAADEIRSPGAVAPPETTVPEDELQGALDLAEALTTDDLSDLTDHYKEAVESVITAKIEDKQLDSGEAPALREPVVVDLMAALNESVEKAREARGGTGEHATVHDMPAAKRTAKKETAAKKTTQRKRKGT